MRYLLFNPDTKIITGSQESPTLSGPGVVIDADGSKYQTYITAISNGALPNMVTWDGSNVIIGDDPRALFRVAITTDQPAGPNGEDIILADGASVATVSITMVDGLGETIPYSGIHIAEFFDNRIAMLSYVNGTAIKTFKTNKSGRYILNSTNNYKLTGEVNVLAVEV